MLRELIDEIAAGFWPYFPEQAMPLGVRECEDAVTDEEKAGKIEE